MLNVYKNNTNTTRKHKSVPNPDFPSLDIPVPVVLFSSSGFLGSVLQFAPKERKSSMITSREAGYKVFARRKNVMRQAGLIVHRAIRIQVHFALYVLLYQLCFELAEISMQIMIHEFSWWKER